ncbi:MAG TPA: penicillin acylase family protein [Saprospiraceae bacterium]|nr:penicillin acylase family protein [Saprospiraceae bacterium]HMP25015.1 penicillin acylase family protein [Saprospiraceae bacterium]
MKRFFTCFLTIITIGALSAQPFTTEEISRWMEQAQRIEIIRDNWGIPHIYGKTDADAVFGVLYTQCEDDFARVEMNYIDAIGRMAEVEGEKALYHDLRARMFLDTTQAMAIYQTSPAWMKKLLDAFADGVNYYLHTHPEVQPRLLTRFQPWMPLMFSEGSIGGNISVVSLARLQAFYEEDPTGGTSWVEDFDRYEREPLGSNGFAIAPAKSVNKNALLLINPHTSFYFRSEVHMISKQGLNAYGAVTWGQFFIYQGFNQHCGWMHTSSSADSVDEYYETIEKKDGQLYYKYGNEMRPVQTQTVRLPYKTTDGMREKEFVIYRTHHGPVIRTQNGKWITIRMMNEPLQALTQSYLRTKAKHYKSFRKTMTIRTNSSNNTVFADRKGNIAYWHGNFIPRRDPSFDWSQPVDGSNPQTEWRGLHELNEMLFLHNPPNGWLQNCNSTPFTAAGTQSPSPDLYPSYMAPDAENFRGINAVRVLSNKTIFNLDTLISAANDPYLAGFEKLIPSLEDAYYKVSNPSADVAAAIDVLRAWDYRYDTASVATTLAVYWGEKVQAFARTLLRPDQQRMTPLSFQEFIINNTGPLEKINLLVKTLDELKRDFGTWRMPWGEVNRFQRITGDIQSYFLDTEPSLPVGFTSSAWGSLAAYGARAYSNTKKRYGNVGNSFVAVVEFGKRIEARSVVSGGQSSDPDSPHFNDQSELFVRGQFKTVHFYPEAVRQHAERSYRPGK